MGTVAPAGMPRFLKVLNIRHHPPSDPTDDPSSLLVRWPYVLSLAGRFLGTLAQTLIRSADEVQARQIVVTHLAVGQITSRVVPGPESVSRTPSMRPRSRFLHHSCPETSDIRPLARTSRLFVWTIPG
jgi:hypothetical protein